MRIRVEVDELDELAVDLGDVPERAAPAILQVTRRAAANMKRELQSEAVGSRRFRGVRPSISWDVEVDAEGVSAEVGPEIGRRQGSLGFIAYEGSATSGPRFPDPMGALEREAEPYAAWLSRVVEEAL